MGFLVFYSSGKPFICPRYGFTTRLFPPSWPRRLFPPFFRGVQHVSNGGNAGICGVFPHPTRNGGDGGEHGARGAPIFANKGVRLFRGLRCARCFMICSISPRYLFAPLFARLSAISFLYRSLIWCAALKAENAHNFRAPAVENALKTAEKRRKAAAPLWAEKPH